MPVKALLQLAAAIFAAMIPAFVSAQSAGWPEWINAGILAATAAQVYITTNHYDHPVWKYLKTGASSLAVVGVLVVSGWSDPPFTGAEIAQSVIAVLGTTGVLLGPRDDGMRGTTIRRQDVPRQGPEGFRTIENPVPREEDPPGYRYTRGRHAAPDESGEGRGQWPGM